ncbi:MAG: MarR family winged helix-turn-helix transcriptional regulator [Roseobacter sp.]
MIFTNLYGCYLEILITHGGATVPEIAHKLKVKRQYVPLMVNETLAENLAFKNENPRHKRSTLIALTNTGRGMIEDVVRREKILVELIGAGLDTISLASCFARSCVL